MKVYMVTQRAYSRGGRMPSSDRPIGIVLAEDVKSALESVPDDALWGEPDGGAIRATECGEIDPTAAPPFFFRVRD